MLVDSYTTLEETRLWTTGARRIRVDEYLTYELPFEGDAPLTNEVSTPSGYTYKGCRNRMTKKIPLMGVHSETFFKEGEWVEE